MERLARYIDELAQLFAPACLRDILDEIYCGWRWDTLSAEEKNELLRLLANAGSGEVRLFCVEGANP